MKLRDWRNSSPVEKGKALRKLSISKVLGSIILPILFFLFWSWCGNTGRLNTNLIPTPEMLWQTFLDMVEKGTLQKNIAISFSRVLKGYAIGLLAGLFAGVCLGLSKRLGTLFSFFTGLLRPIPIIAWVPILILFLGIDEEYKVAMIAIGSFWPILLNTTQGIRGVSQSHIEVARMYEKSKLEILTGVILPEALPSIFTGMRLGIGSAWSCVVGAEMLAAASGIGYVIMYAREMFHPEVMYVGVLSIGLVGLLIDFVILRIQNFVLRWM